MKLKCNYCNGLFKSYNSKKKFCSASCYSNFRRLKRPSRKEKREYAIIRNNVEKMINLGYSDKQISKEANISIGDYFTRGTVIHYKRCIKNKNRYNKLYFSRIGIKGAHNAGLVTHKLYASKQREWGKMASEVHKENGTNFFNSDYQREMGRRGGKKIKEMRKNSKEFNKKYIEMCRMGGYAVHKKYPGLAYRNALLSLKSLRKNRPYKFMDCNFDSNKERECCKLLIYHKIIKNPVEGVNIHFQVDSIEIDFFPQQKIFIEYHPWDWNGRTTEEYYQERRKILNENDFCEFPLIITKKLADFEIKALLLLR